MSHTSHESGNPYEGHNRNHDVYCDATGKHYATPVAFDDANSRNFGDRQVFGRAPWFNRDTLGDMDLMRLYVNEDDELPSGIPFTTLES